MSVFLYTSAVRRNQFEWKWYCEQDHVAAQALSFVVVGWLPSLLLMLWQGMVLPLTMYLLVQVRSYSLKPLWPTPFPVGNNIA